MVSVLILTYNEEKNIEQCLNSLVDFSNDIYVLDSFSDDKTIDIAKKYVDEKNILFRIFDDYSSQRNWGLKNIGFENEWLLMIDADEVLTKEVKNSIQEELSKNTDQYVGFIGHYRVFFMNHPLNYRLWPFNKKIMFRHSEIEFNRAINEHPMPVSNTRTKWGKLEGKLEHRDNKTLHDHFAKHNRYSTMEAFRIIEEKKDRINWGRIYCRSELKKLYYRLPFRKTMYFLYLFIFRLGFMDGRNGLDFIITRLIYQIEIDLKMREIGTNSLTLTDYISFKK